MVFGKSRRINPAKENGYFALGHSLKLAGTYPDGHYFQDHR